LAGKMFGHAQPMIGFAEQQQAGVGGNPLVGRANLDSPIKLGFK